MGDIKYVYEQGIELLQLAQQGNKNAEELLIVEIRNRFMNKRIAIFIKTVSKYAYFAVFC